MFWSDFFHFFFTSGGAAATKVPETPRTGAGGFLQASGSGGQITLQSIFENFVTKLAAVHQPSNAFVGNFEQSTLRDAA